MLEDLLHDGDDARAGFISGVLPFHWAQVVNIKRDPFETSIGSQYKTLQGSGGSIGSPSTAYVYEDLPRRGLPRRGGWVAAGAFDCNRQAQRHFRCGRFARAALAALHRRSSRSDTAASLAASDQTDSPARAPSFKTPIEVYDQHNPFPDHGTVGRSSDGAADHGELGDFYESGEVLAWATRYFPELTLSAREILV